MFTMCRARGLSSQEMLAKIPDPPKLAKSNPFILRPSLHRRFASSCRNGRRSRSRLSVEIFANLNLALTLCYGNWSRYVACLVVCPCRWSGRNSRKWNVCVPTHIRGGFDLVWEDLNNGAGRVSARRAFTIGDVEYGAVPSRRHSAASVLFISRHYISHSQ